MIELACCPVDSRPDPATPVSSSVLRTYLALAGALGGAATAVLMLMAILANGGGGERIADMYGEGYARTLVGALAVSLSKPRR